jgi:hypothetical protein
MLHEKRIFIFSTISNLRAFDFRSTSDPPELTIEAEIGIYLEIEGSTLIISTGESNRAILEHMIATLKYSS